MNAFLSRIISGIKDIFNKLDKTKRIIVAAVAAVVILAFVVLVNVSSGEPNVLLFSELSSNDFGSVTKKLEELGYFYKASGGAAVFVRPRDREVILTKLAQEDSIPKGIPGWKLFDITKWTDTERELSVKYMRALRDEVKKHIESLKNIDKASVDIAIAEDTIYTDKNSPYTAAVTVHLADGYDKLSKKEIKGIVQLVSRAVGNRLKPEDVTVTDELGKIISDFNDEVDAANTELVILENRKKMEEQMRVKMLKDIKGALQEMYTEDRIQVVRLNMDCNWDKIKEHQKEHTPVVMQEDNPLVPYNTRVVKDSLEISKKDTDENFKGHGYNPQGPAGTDSNTPPGYKASDDQYAEYNKKETITNFGVNVADRDIERDLYKVTRVSISIAIDGLQDLPKQPDGSYDLDANKPVVQNPVPDEDLRKVKNLVEKAINFNAVRGDQVAVENIMFDRTNYWNSLREEYRRKEQMKKLILAGIIGVVTLFIGFILFRTIQREIERRRRLKEEQLALEQQRMRDAALRVAEDEGIDVELSLEERARMELQQNAINLAKERPDDVAKLLRTWLAEE
ncbi:MAG: flagellar M-ring protein FliF [Leptospirales bacterium]|nr:flagellar M-ring protein FliF [Leptospirales bacterium]